MVKWFWTYALWWLYFIFDIGSNFTITCLNGSSYDTVLCEEMQYFITRYNIILNAIIFVILHIVSSYITVLYCILWCFCTLINFQHDDFPTYFKIDSVGQTGRVYQASLYVSCVLYICTHWRLFALDWNLDILYICFVILTGSLVCMPTLHWL